MNKYIDRELTLCYLGYRGNKPSGEILPLIEDCEKILQKCASPKRAFQVYDRALCPVDTDSEKLRSHLDGCDQLILFASTLGGGVDGMIRRLSVTDMARAVILDASANAFLERYCEDCDKEISMLFEQKHLTWRYSPGYDGFSIESQRDIIKALDTPKKIGLSLSEGLMLTPQKSTTAIIGLSDNILPKKRTGCAVCNMKETCNFRKEGSHCGF